MLKYFFIVLFSLVGLSCSNLSDEELWLKVEEAKAGNNWDSTMLVCQRILAEYPDGNYASWARFGLAESYRFKNQPREALDNYKLFYELHPDKQPSALSLFLVGYIYNNNLQMRDSAKKFYEQFLLKYPLHDLAPTVKFELETLGLSPQEALDEKQKTKRSVVKK
ncbi:MAG: tetratricopeptide repeat protein [Ignavibacteriales bacterium]|nr:tetratricopeptide repeat protein [Ignavibacteriales bacterium]